MNSASETLRTACVTVWTVNELSASAPIKVSHCRKQLPAGAFVCTPSSEPKITISIDTSGENTYLPPMPQPAFCAISEASGTLAGAAVTPWPNFHSHKGMLTPNSFGLAAISMKCQKLAAKSASTEVALAQASRNSGPMRGNTKCSAWSAPCTGLAGVVPENWGALNQSKGVSDRCSSSSAPAARRNTSDLPSLLSQTSSSG